MIQQLIAGKEKKEGLEKRKSFGINERFRSKKKLSEALLRFHGFHSMYVGYILQTKFLKILKLLQSVFGPCSTDQPQYYLDQAFIFCNHFLCLCE